jgi:ATP-dependent Clp protease adaptor protein ClpS
MSTVLEEVPETTEDTDTKPGLLPPYNVVIKNDDFHTMAFVVLLLMEVFNYDKMHSFKLMAMIHEEGEAIVWTGSKEVAELKLEQVLARPEADLGPLDARIEPAR